jgi:hypothetical protein
MFVFVSSRDSDALAKRKEFNIEHTVVQSIMKEQKEKGGHGHDCVQVQEIRNELEALKACQRPPHAPM